MQFYSCLSLFYLPPYHLIYTHRENTLSKRKLKYENEKKSMNMYISAISTLNQFFVKDSYTQIKFSKN